MRSFLSIRSWRNVVADTSGATMIEYGLVAAFVVVVAVVSVANVGSKVNSAFSTTAAAAR